MPVRKFDTRYYVTAALTDKGLVRGNNEDAMLCLPEKGCFVISDGMGGGDAGEISSSIIVGYVGNAVARAPLLPHRRRQAVTAALYASSKAIAKYAAGKNYDSMGATATCLLLDPWNPCRADIYHAGDSRLYRLRKKTLEALTNDHTVATASGVPDDQLPRYMQGILTNVVGMPGKFFLDCTEIEVAVGDIFLLCTDGLYRQLDHAAIRRELLSGAAPEKMLENFRDQANRNGGIDNLSAVLLRIDELPPSYESTTDEIQADHREVAGSDEEDGNTPPTEE